MSGTVAVTTGQPIVVPGADAGGWVPAGAAALPSRRNLVEVRFILYDVDSTNNASMILEGANEVAGGVASHSEVLEPGADISCAPGQQKTYVLRNCAYAYVRLSAAGPSPSYPSTNVQGGIEVIP